MADRADLKSLLPDELRDLVSQLGEKPYRANQLYSWLHDKGAVSLEEMTDLSKGFRQTLAEVGFVSQLRVIERQEAGRGKAVKFLFEVAEGLQVEAVLIRDAGRRTACLSSQVGCALDCRFCATGKMGFRRNLTASQIIGQLHHISRAAAEAGERVSNVVMMGMGEPLTNYENVVRAVRHMRLETGPSVGGRRITVSTAGYLPGIRRLADDDLNVGLAISLNATTDEVRSRIMPINRKYPIAALIDAAAEYFDKRGRRVTFEYVLMDGVTDSEEDARRLAELTRPVPCKINLIPYNELGPQVPVEGAGSTVFRRPERETLRRFEQVLRARSPRTVTMRDSQGRDIDAACGQLYQKVASRRAVSDTSRPGRPGDST